MSDPFVEDLIALLPRLRRYALALTKSPDVADDLVQATCEKAITNRHQFAPGSRFDSWLFRILRNQWIDLVRHNKVRGDAVPVEDADALVSDVGTETSERALQLADTARAIGELPEPYREVLILVCVEELSYQETADVLGVPIGTVTSRLARARQRLSDTLEETPTPARSSKAQDT